MCLYSDLLWDPWAGSQSGSAECAHSYIVLYRRAQKSNWATESTIVLSRRPIQALQNRDAPAMLPPKSGCCLCSSRIIFILSNFRLLGSSVLFMHQLMQSSETPSAQPATGETCQPFMAQHNLHLAGSSGILQKRQRPIEKDGKKNIKVVHEGIRKGGWTATDVGKLNKGSKLRLEKVAEEGALQIQSQGLTVDKYGSRYIAFVSFYST